MITIKKVSKKLNKEIKELRGFLISGYEELEKEKEPYKIKYIESWIRDKEESLDRLCKELEDVRRGNVTVQVEYKYLELEEMIKKADRYVTKLAHDKLAKEMNI